MGLGDRCPRHVESPRLVPFPDRQSCVDVACGDCHTMAVTTTGALFAWGEGKCGQVCAWS